AFAEIEDLSGSIEVVIWPSTWDETKSLWQPERILLVRGKIDAQGGEPKLLCDDATTNLDLWEATGDVEPRSLTWAVEPPAYQDDEFALPPTDDYTGPEPPFDEAPLPYQAAADGPPPNGHGNAEPEAPAVVAESLPE